MAAIALEVVELETNELPHGGRVEAREPKVVGKRKRADKRAA